MAMNIRDPLMRAYWRLERLITPGLQYSQASYEDALERAIMPGSRWLDIGCGHQILPPWRRASERDLVARAERVVGVDPDHEALRQHGTIQLRSCASVSDLPFPPRSFDIVTANMVVEHLPHPETQFAEVNRVLRDDGVFLFHTPNARSYTTMLARMIPSSLKSRLVGLLEARREEDLYPTHYRANTARRLHEIAGATGFEVVSVRSVLSSAEFAVVLPLAVLELLWIRLLMLPSLEGLRHTFLVTIRKQAATAPDAARATAADAGHSA